MPPHPFNTFQNGLPTPHPEAARMLENHLQACFDAVFPGERSNRTDGWQRAASIIKGTALRHTIARLSFLAKLPRLAPHDKEAVITEVCRATCFTEHDVTNCFMRNNDKNNLGVLLPSTLVIWFNTKEYFGSPGIGEQRTRDIIKFLASVRYIGSQWGRENRSNRNSNVFLTEPFIKFGDCWLNNRELPPVPIQENPMQFLMERHTDLHHA
jgi:hypothetical protein